MKVYHCLAVFMIIVLLATAYHEKDKKKSTNSTSQTNGQNNIADPSVNPKLETHADRLAKFKEVFAGHEKYDDVVKKIDSGLLQIKEIRKMYVTCYTWNTNKVNGRYGSYETSSGENATYGDNALEKPRTFATYWPEINNGTYLFVQDFGYGKVHDQCGASERDYKAGKMTRIDAFIGKYPNKKAAEEGEKERTGVKWVVVFE